MRKQWRCFHCDQVFTRKVDAAEHFGAHQEDTPACCMRDHEHHLVHYIRRLEQELSRYRADDSDVMRSIATLEADHGQALARAEEEGYGRGVRDARREFQPLDMGHSEGQSITTEPVPGTAAAPT